MTTESTPLYLALAHELRDAMSDGRLQAGARLPSVREAARSRGLSINTVLAAYRQLEARGFVEARPQSGYFVRSRLAAPPA
ncbi:winged helix-turn-helix domain-containing protein, partial [Arthrospira platensis SPKY2]